MTDSQRDRRAGLIRLVNKIQSESGCVVDIDALIEQFEKSATNPAASRLIFDPPDGKRRSPDEIVDIAIGKAVK